ncbi:hypothetical protein DB30_03666 [Enhygromyxa salina]|uniref:Uncharacterized protein n=1 Tax=Enhygromyxa salina TaxID=215803 RepID=A0A0C1ZHI9_9BACT|nr:hypothetical protein [Enhygromyxa salina]KIG17069.1 hypothetical protein DB30_03666 [Enhygromyxa salina]
MLAGARPAPLALLVSLGMALSACSDNGEDDQVSSTSLASSTDGEGDGDDETGDGDGDGDPVDPDDGSFAADIAIDTVEINQGVGVTIVQSGQLVAANGWSAPLIGGRPGLIRVLWSTNAEFTPRNILARLSLLHADGTTDQFSQTRMISGPPTQGFIDGSFAFEFDASELREGDSLVLGLFEADAGQAGTDTDIPRIPAAGEAALEVVGGNMEIKVVVLPANDPAVENASFELPAALREMMETDLFNLYPINTMSVEYHAPVQITDCYDGAAILAQVSNYRNSENAGPNVYYHAIFAESHEGNCWAGGMAWLVDDSMGADRVSYSINHWGASPNNFTHELGHSSGRPHSFDDGAYQPGSAGSPDCGRRFTWGYPVRPGQHPKAVEWDFPPMQTLDHWLIAPTEGLALGDYCYGHDDYDTWGPALNDVMSYAFPYWISAYTYRNLAQRIATLSSWDNAGAAANAQVLHGVFMADGEVRWYVMPGRVETGGDDLQRRARGRANGRAWTGPVAPKITGEGEVRGLILPLPEHVEGVIQIEFDGRALEVDLARDVELG